jgi:two-component system chemotaxis response regulator CheB
MINVLIVDDSPTAREHLSNILSADPEINVAGTANNGEEALEAIRNKDPDIITMDLYMPRMGGIETTCKIMQTYPRPVVIVSDTFEANEVEMTFHAIEAGALAAVQRPVGTNHPDFEKTSKTLVQTVRLMSEVKVVRRRPGLERKESTSPDKTRIEPGRTDARIVAIGSSTGGPSVIKNILSALDEEFSAPILIVQHLVEGFVGGFVEWLSQTSRVLVHVASDNVLPLPGHAYVAPDGFQMRLETNGRISLDSNADNYSHRPSIACLFHSVADVFGQNAIGVLLTGMGKDGAEELGGLKEKGAMTIVQDEESSVVFGMPAEAIKLNAARYVLSGNEIAGTLTHLIKKATPEFHE